MTDKSEATWLTAAECAARTCLTVRALRVYEDYGLISPRRTAGGWRYYGERELIRLNTIALLKAAGLTLAQIRAATNLSEQDPSLQHVLRMQVEAWKTKQADAARGQAIVETALKSLVEHKSLSIDELCDLVRSLETHGRESDASIGASDMQAVNVDAKILDRYVGFYRYGEYAVATITREGNRLFGKWADHSTLELIAQSEEEFASTSVNVQVRFVCEAQEPATSAIVYQQGMRVTAARIDADIVDEMNARLDAKIKSQRPTPGSDLALRRVLDGVKADKPNYPEMSAGLTQIIRQQLPVLQAIANYQGSIRTIEFRGVGKQGWDVYEVRCEHGSCQWRISLASAGIVEGVSAMVTDPQLLSAPRETNPSSTDEDSMQGPTPGSEAALRRMIDSIRNGAPNYDEMSPLLAISVRQQLTLFQTIGQRLGGLVSIEYKGSVTRRFDIFDLQRENGSARWRISMGQNGTIAEANAMLTGSSVGAGP